MEGGEVGGADVPRPRRLGTPRAAEPDRVRRHRVRRQVGGVIVDGAEDPHRPVRAAAALVDLGVALDDHRRRDVAQREVEPGREVALDRVAIVFDRARAEAARREVDLEGGPKRPGRDVVLRVDVPVKIIGELLARLRARRVELAGDPDDRGDRDASGLPVDRALEDEGLRVRDSRAQHAEPPRLVGPVEPLLPRRVGRRQPADRRVGQLHRVLLRSSCTK